MCLLCKYVSSVFYVLGSVLVLGGSSECQTRFPVSRCSRYTVGETRKRPSRCGQVRERCANTDGALKPGRDGGVGSGEAAQSGLYVPRLRKRGELHRLREGGGCPRQRGQHVQRLRGKSELGPFGEQPNIQSGCGMVGGSGRRLGGCWELRVRGPRAPAQLGCTYCGHWYSAAACPCTPSQHAQTPVFWNKSKGLEPPGSPRGAGSHSR